MMSILKAIGICIAAVVLIPIALAVAAFAVVFTYYIGMYLLCGLLFALFHLMSHI